MTDGPQKEVDYLNNVIGKDKLSQYTANIAFAGFTAPKLFMGAGNEPENFARIEKIMLPKDYIAYKMTGVHCNRCVRCFRNAFTGCKKPLLV